MSEIEKKIECVIYLFRMLNSRDLFMSTYINCLALRLIQKSSLSDEAEEKMI